MSEEKLYAVKNNEGKYLDCEYEKFLPLSESYCPTMVSEDNAKAIVNDYGGHVVTLVEEPKKVVLSKKQAKIVEGARDATYPASYISNYTNSHDCEENLLINAYVNGYTVAKEKKYLLPMDGTLEENDDNDNFQLYAYCYKGRWLADEVETDPSYQHNTVTQKELETAPAWVKAIKPLEVTDDDD